MISVTTMQMIPAVKEYVSALFEIAAERDRRREFLSALSTVRDLVRENPDYPAFLSSPAVPMRERLSSIDEAFGATLPEEVVSFLKILCENGRASTIEICADEFEKIVMESYKTTTAIIQSAVELTDEEKKRVVSTLEARVAKTIDPRFIVDPSLIGGLRIEIDGKVLDGSLKHRLRHVKDVILG